jgi:spore germination protein KC
MEPRGKGQLTINKVALLDKHKQKLVLTPLETKFFNSFYQGVGKYDIGVHQGNQSYVVSAENLKTRYSFGQTPEGKPLIKVKITVSGFVEESTNMNLKRSDLTQLEKSAEQTVQAAVMQLLTKLQKAGLDPIGFGLRYRARHLDSESAWKEWTELYPNIEFQVSPKVDITSTGVIG